MGDGCSARKDVISWGCTVSLRLCVNSKRKTGFLIQVDTVTLQKKPAWINKRIPVPSVTNA